MKTKLILIALIVTSFFAKAQDPQKTLSDAITSGMMENVTIAVDQQKADVNKPYKDKLMNNYPIHTACFVLNVKAVAYLIEKKADVNAKNRFNATPINLLCQSFMSDTASTTKILAIVDMLMAAGAKIDVNNGGGHTAIAYAAERNNLKLVQKLISYKADPNVRGASKGAWLPLMHAAKVGNLEMVKALVEAGAKVNEIREHAEGAFMITENAASMASDGNFTDVVEYLKTKGAKPPKTRKIYK